MAGQIEISDSDFGVITSSHFSVLLLFLPVALEILLAQLQSSLVFFRLRFLDRFGGLLSYRELCDMRLRRLIWSHGQLLGLGNSRDRLGRIEVLCFLGCCRRLADAGLGAEGERPLSIGGRCPATATRRHGDVE